VWQVHDVTDNPMSASPPRTAPTAEWLAEQNARNQAYEGSRRQHIRAWFHHGEPDPDPQGTAELAAGTPARKPARGKIHDKRQGSLDV
jgi:hypothetical protein